jgi:tRNA G18 (ribose-2'-O)-methylase SpoU
MRGYFAIGAEGMSKPMNLGALMRTAHAFGASFVFTVNTGGKLRHIQHADTSKTFKSVPYYKWEGMEEMAFPKGCQLVGIELTDDAVDLPEFKHPRNAAYILGPEKGRLSDPMMEQCKHVVKIPTKFCVNVALAGGLVMYDRMLQMAAYRDKPIMPGGPKD